MDHHDGGYGYPPYDEDPRESTQGQGTPLDYQDDPAAYNPGSTQQYDPNAGTYDQGYAAGPSGYDQRGYYVQPAQSGYPDPENPYAPRPIDPNYGYDYSQQDGGASGAQQGYYTQPQQPADGGYVQQGYYAQPQQPTDESYSQQGYYPPQSGDEGYVQQRGAGQYYSDPEDTYGSHRQEHGLFAPQRYGRTTMSQGGDPYGYTPRGNTARTRMPEDVEEYSPRGNTTRTRYPKSDDQYIRESGDELDLYERPRSSGKKKRSKFGKFMHALGLYLAQLPAKTLVIIGGSFAMVLVAVILLAVLLPNSNRTERPDDGVLSITDTTPTPSLVPTNTPAPTAEVTPTPTLPVLTDNISDVGTINELIPDIQKRLVELAYMEEPDGGFTDKFGKTTKTAIRLFQMKNYDDSKYWDGILGNGTYSLLMSDDAKAYYLTRGDGDDRTKVITKLVQDVTDLQNRLITLGYLTPGSATGLYGSTTVDAVMKFQEYHGLSPIDGKAGQETLETDL